MKWAIPSAAVLWISISPAFADRTGYFFKRHADGTVQRCISISYGRTNMSLQRRGLPPKASETKCEPLKVAKRRHELNQVEKADKNSRETPDAEDLPHD
jgi:hypothetical protein